LSSLEATLLQTIGALEEMSRSPRRAPGDSIRGATTSITLPDGRQITVPMVTVPANAFDMLGRLPRRGDSSSAPTTPIPPKKPPV
jgi:hypothetical protein